MKKQTPTDKAKTATKIIKSDLRVLIRGKSDYPLTEKMNEIDHCKWRVPERLLIFLQHLIPSKLKQVSIGPCTAQALRPKSMLVSIPLGIGVDICNSFATRLLVDHLKLPDLSLSSDEVKLFKQSAVISDSMKATETEHFTQ